MNVRTGRPSTTGRPAGFSKKVAMGACTSQVQKKILVHDLVNQEPVWRDMTLSTTEEISN